MVKIEHLEIETPDGYTTCLAIGIARSFLARLGGLLIRPRLKEGEGLLLPECSSIHMFGMRYAIDVVWLDASGRILKCVQDLKPWRASACRGAYAALELAAGTIDRLNLHPGQHLPPLGPVGKVRRVRDLVLNNNSLPCPEDAALRLPVDTPSRSPATNRQTGASMIEFVVVAPALLLIGLGIIHYGLLFFAKNNINYAAFEAARAGSVANADLSTVQTAYKKALIPLYGGGRTQQELQDAYDRVKNDLTSDTLKIELLNPTTESFDDWNAKTLQDDKDVGNGKRVIPVLMQNYPQALANWQMTRDPKSIGPTSGQTLSDASLIKVRVIHGYKPQVPVIGKMLAYLAGYNEHDTFRKKIYDAGRIPIVSHVTLQMQSNAIESTNVSSPGMGNDGHPVNPNPGDDSGTASTDPSPPCTGTFCTSQTTPACDPAKDPNCGSGGQDTCPGVH
jgi:uncharacterized membrane protein (UPF0127 family)